MVGVDNWMLWVGVALLVALVTAIVGYLLALRADQPGRTAKSGVGRMRTQRQENLSPEQLAQQQKIAELRSIVKAAEDNLRKTERTQKREQRRGQRMLSSAASAKTKRLLSFRGQDGFVYLTPLEIRVREGTFPVTSNLTAEAGMGGDLIVKRRSTLTRIATGGILFGPMGALVGAAAQKTTYKDDREVFLLIEGDQFVSLIVVKPKQARAAATAVAKIRQAALSLEQFKRDNQTQVTAGNQTLMRAEKQNKNVEAATQNLSAARQRLADAELEAAAMAEAAEV